MRRLIGSLCGLLLALPAAAAIHYKSDTKSETQGRSGGFDMSVEAWVDGDRAKVEFTASGNPLLPAGSYLVTTDGGATVLLVNPAEETYTEWDVNAMLGAASSIMEGMGGMFDMQVQNPQVEKLSEGPGESMLGYSTTHTQIRSSWDLQMKVMGMKRAMSNTSLQDLWTTDELSDPGFGIWLRRDPPSTGNEGLDAMMHDQAAALSGVPLKMVVESTSTSGKGKTEVSRTTMLVTELEEVGSLPDDMFVVDPSYQKTELLPTAAGEEGEAANPLAGLFGRQKKDG